MDLGNSLSIYLLFLALSSLFGGSWRRGQEGLAQKTRAHNAGELDKQLLRCLLHMWHVDVSKQTKDPPIAASELPHAVPSTALRRPARRQTDGEAGAPGLVEAGWARGEGRGARRPSTSFPTVKSCQGRVQFNRDQADGKEPLL